MKTMFVRSLVLLSVVTLCYCAGSAPKYTECQSSGQCGSGRCCVVVNGRYPTTACESRRHLGEQCRRASDHPINQTLSFPGGVSVQVTDVHYSVCPCQHGTVCSRGICVMEGTSGRPGNNHVLDHY